MNAPTKKKQELYNFYDALKLIIEGERVTKLEWNNLDVYGVLQDGRLRLRKEDKKFYDWILSDGDLEGGDYIKI